VEGLPRFVSIIDGSIKREAVEEVAEEDRDDSFSCVLVASLANA